MGDSDNNLPSEIPPEIEEALKDDTAEPREIIRTFMSMTLATMRRENSIMEKLSPEQLSDVIRNDEAERKRGFQDRRESKIMAVIVMILVLLTFGFIIVQLKASPEILEKILTIVGSLAAGVLGGYGVGFHRGKKSSDD